MIKSYLVAPLCVLSPAGEEEAGCFNFIVLWMFCRCCHSLPLPRCAMDWSVVCDCDISLSYSHTYYSDGHDLGLNCSSGINKRINHSFSYMNVLVCQALV